MSNERKHHTPEEKVAILRRRLFDRIPVSTLRDEHQLHPTIFYRWLKQFFENGTALLGPRRGPISRLKPASRQSSGEPILGRLRAYSPRKIIFVTHALTHLPGPTRSGPSGRSRLRPSFIQMPNYMLGGRRSRSPISLLSGASVGARER